MRRSTLIAPTLVIGSVLVLPACKEDPPKKDPVVEICDNGVDDDGDGARDCYDTDCLGTPECTTDTETLCKNGFDDDGDGLKDCDDPDCKENDACRPKTEEDCGDYWDDDADGLTDCEDDDCIGSVYCVEDCTDEIDNDADGYTDCEDDECKDEDSCQEDCNDGIDNDQDDDTDCEDRDCRDEDHCQESLYCDDGSDNDADGLIDCEDADCTDDCDEVCDDGEDNDADQLVDCYDDECWGADGCLEVTVWVNGIEKWRSNKMLDLYRSYVIGEGYGGTSTVETREATAYTVSGSLSLTRDSAPMVCNWWLTKAQFTQDSSGDGTVDKRKSWGTSGGCYVESGVLPQDVYIGWYPNAALALRSYGGPAWYAVDAGNPHAFSVDSGGGWTLINSTTYTFRGTYQKAVFYTNDSSGVIGGSPTIGFANP